MSQFAEYATPKLRELSVSERPQERLERLGANALSDIELLAMLLRSGSKGRNVLTVATQLLSDAGSLADLIAWTNEDFRKIKGIGKVKALQLVTVVEICRRVLASAQDERPLMDTPEIVARWMQSLTLGLEVEKFWTLCLNRKNRLLKLCETTSGTANNSLVHPREVFRDAIRHGASAIICVHNHPSGDPLPSSADIQVTRQLREASKTIGIALLDHIIVGAPKADPSGRGHYSFQEAGLM